MLGRKDMNNPILGLKLQAKFDAVKQLLLRLLRLLRQFFRHFSPGAKFDSVKQPLLRVTALAEQCGENQDMNNPILGPKLQAKFDSVKQLLLRVSALAEQCGENQAKSTLLERLKTLDAAALFVIAERVNGNETLSFIN
jgi:hypothetical protein